MIAFSASFQTLPDPILNALSALKYIRYVTGQLTHYQLSPVLLSPEEQRALVPPFVLLEGHPAPTDEDARTNVMFALYQHRERLYQRQRDDLSALRSCIVDGVDESTRVRWIARAPKRNLEAMSIRDLLSFFREFHVTLSHGQLSLLADSLLVPFVHGVTALDVHLTHHANIHELAECNGEPWRDTLKVTTLQRSLSSSPIFTFAIQLWNQGHPTLVAQDYDEFVTALYAAYNTAPAVPVTDLPLAGHAVIVGTKSVPEASVRGPTFYFCSTHGFQMSHWSADCNAPNTTHQVAARHPPDGYAVTWRTKGKFREST